MNNELYYIWLSHALDGNCNLGVTLLRQFVTAKDIFLANREDFLGIEGVTSHIINRLMNKRLELSQQIYTKCQNKRIRIISFESGLYPKRLKDIYDPPLVLYGIGNLHCLNDPVMITVVGTRKPTSYCENATRIICQELVKQGITIVSGCAVGIDGVAHRAAVDKFGATVGVLGCGVDVDYPKPNHDLKVRIIREGGAIISEYPPGTSPNPLNFPKRNRIMAGLSTGVFVTQAADKSGSLITASIALDQGKEIFCLPPNDIFDDRLAGVVKYLRDGAIPVYAAQDILNACYSTEYEEHLANKLYESRLENKVLKMKLDSSDSSEENYYKDEFVPLVKEKPTPKEIDNTLLEELTPQQRTIYDILTGQPLSIDEIVMNTGIKATEVISQLNEMELLGVVRSHSGSRYSR